MALRLAQLQKLKFAPAILIPKLFSGVIRPHELPAYRLFEIRHIDRDAKALIQYLILLPLSTAVEEEKQQVVLLPAPARLVVLAAVLVLVTQAVVVRPVRPFKVIVEVLQVMDMQVEVQ